MPTTVIITATVQAGKTDAFRELLVKMVNNHTRQAAGNESAHVLQDMEDPEKLVLIEEWDTKALHQAFHQQMLITQAELMSQYLTGPLHIQYLEKHQVKDTGNVR